MAISYAEQTRAFDRGARDHAEGRVRNPFVRAGRPAANDDDVAMASAWAVGRDAAAAIEAVDRERAWR